MKTTVKLILFALALLPGFIFDHSISAASSPDFIQSDSIFSTRRTDTVQIDRFGSKEMEIIKYQVEIEIDGKIYKVPVEIPIRIDSKISSFHYFIRGIKLRDPENKEVRMYLQEVFNKPAKYLLEPPGEDWTKLNVYKNYFQKYDKKYSSVGIQSGENDESDPMREPENSTVNDNTDIDFPLPSTIDLEVDLLSNPRKFTALGVEFNFDKLKKNFKDWLIGFKPKSDRSGIKVPID